VISRDLLRQIDSLLRPIRTRIANSIARGVISLVDDSTKMQLVQVGLLATEEHGEVERFAEYGFTSVPPAGSEAVVLFIGGDREHPIVIATGDRATRLTGLGAGETAIHNNAGAQVILRSDGDIEVIPGGSGKVRIGSASASDPVALKSDVDALGSFVATHVHPGVTAGAAVTGTVASGPSAATGATKATAV